MAKRMITANSVELCTESFGDRADPPVLLPHGQALADEIPGATLLTLDGAGHGVDQADWDRIARAIIAHSAPAT